MMGVFILGLRGQNHMGGNPRGTCPPNVWEIAHFQTANYLKMGYVPPHHYWEQIAAFAEAYFCPPPKIPMPLLRIIPFQSRECNLCPLFGRWAEKMMNEECYVSSGTHSLHRIILMGGGGSEVEAWWHHPIGVPPSVDMWDTCKTLLKIPFKLPEMALPWPWYILRNTTFLPMLEN